MREASQDSHCSVARTLEIVSDPWTFLLLREAYFGVRRFDRFKSNLGIPGSTLASRLRRLVEGRPLQTGALPGFSDPP